MSTHAKTNIDLKNITPVAELPEITSLNEHDDRQATRPSKEYQFVDQVVKLSETDHRWFFLCRGSFSNSS